MTTVHFIYRRDKTNTGDWNATPLRCCPELFCGFRVIEHDVESVDYTSMRRGDVFIFGGGGMIDLSDKYNKIINNLLSQNLCVIGWGFGVNHTKDNPVFRQVDFPRFRLLGMRDSRRPSYAAYCPCPSVLQLDCGKPGKGVGAVYHKSNPLARLPDIPFITNSEPLAQIEEFINRYEYIVTNSYHGMYWATLLNKKVILYGVSSSKFDFFKYPAARWAGDLQTSLRSARNYPRAWTESRKAVKKFADSVSVLLSRPPSMQDGPVLPPPQAGRLRNLFVRFVCLFCSRKRRRMIRAKWL